MSGAIAVVGAGLLGRLMAWKLLQRGYRVTLFDSGSRHAELSAAKVAAAMLAPYSEVASADRQVFDWGLLALSWWPRELEILAKESGQEIRCETNGSIVLAHERDQTSLQHFQQQLQRRVPDYIERVQRCDRNALQALEPELALHFSSGLYLPDEGYLDNTALLSALEAAITKAGGIWREFTRVEGVAPFAVNTGQAEEGFDLVIDSRGLGAKQALPTLRGVRGEVLWVHAPEVDITRPIRLMHPRYRLYVVPRPNHRYVVGATEIESESMAPVTVRSNLELLSALYTLHSGFAEANVEQAYAHCRPAMPDNLPVVNDVPGLMQLNGLYRHGYLLSPYVVEEALSRIASSKEQKLT